MAIKAYDATTDAELDSMLEESRRNPKTNAIEAKYLPESDQVMVPTGHGSNSIAASRSASRVPGSRVSRTPPPTSYQTSLSKAGLGLRGRMSATRLLTTSRI
jgi:hypothetical protein